MVANNKTKVRARITAKDASKILNEVGNAPIFKEETTRKNLPFFTKDELLIGDILGVGSSGVVKEIKNIENHSKKSIDDTKELMSRNCLRHGNCRYAMKYLRNGDNLSEREIARGRIDFAVEVKYLKALTHPSIIKLRGLGGKDLLHPNFFFLMDRLQCTLEERIQEWKTSSEKTKESRGGLFRKSSVRKNNILLRKKLEVAYDVASACEYLHSHKLIHRDIKPENVGFDIRDDVKIFDFGLAKSLHPDLHARNGLYNLTVITGSLPYMAPEVAKKQPYNEKCDVFSYAMMFWEMMVMKELFPYFKTRHEIYQKVILGGLRPRIPLRAWPSTVDTMISKAWKPSSKNRPTMNQICNTLRTALKNEFDEADNRNKLLRNRSSQSLECLIAQEIEL